jgi:acyl carrier protein
MTLDLADLQILVGLQLGIRNVDESAHLVEDLAAESADILNIVLAIEDKYQVSIDEAELSDVRSTSDLYALVQRKVNPE